MTFDNARGLWNSTFFPSQEENNRLRDILRKGIEESLAKKGADCTNCRFGKYVQQSPYYDYTSCVFDEKIEVPNGLDDYRHCCERYETMEY